MTEVGPTESTQVLSPSNTYGNYSYEAKENGEAQDQDFKTNAVGAYVPSSVSKNYIPSSLTRPNLLGLRPSAASKPNFTKSTLTGPPKPSGFLARQVAKQQENAQITQTTDQVVSGSAPLITAPK